MDRVHAAVEAGRCVVAVGGHLLRDEKVLLALKDRAALPAVALSGPQVPPTRALNLETLARAVGQPDGVLLFIEPEDADRSGLETVAGLLQSAPHKPTLVVVSRGASPLLYQFLFRGMPLQFEKARGAQYLRKLPKPARTEVEPPPVEAVKKAVAKPEGVRRVFVGRDEEVEALKQVLSEGGPVVVSGAEGIGRNALIDHAIPAAELTRHEDVILGRGAGFDTLAARLAELTAGVGANQLAEVLEKGESTPVQIVEAAVAALAAAEDLAGHALVVQPLEAAAGRQLDFFRKDRLATLVMALLGAPMSLRLIFVAEAQPPSWTHEANQAVRRFEVGGIKGRFFHEIFEAYHAPEFPREKFGPMAERLHGHPMAARAFAIEVRRRENGLGLLDDPKFLKMDDASDTANLRKLLRKRMDKLSDNQRGLVARVAHLRLPATGRMLADLGLSRNQRLGMVADGFLEPCGSPEDRRYKVHPLVRSCLRMREISDFDTMRDVAAVSNNASKSAEGADKLAYVQEINRNLIGARRGRDTVRTRFPDHDAELEAVIGMMRSNKPHFQLAQQRLSELLKRHPGNADLHLLKLELLRRLDAKREAIEEAYDEAMAQAPVAEVFQDAATWQLSRKARGKAITILEAGLAALPNEFRLRTRLAALMMRQGRRNEALDHLRAVMEQAPMLPDAYGLMGMARFDEGAEALEEAESLLREAVRLAPEDMVQVPRLVTLLMAKARATDGEAAQAFREESRELLAPLTRAEGKSGEGFLLLAQLERETGNLDRAAWLLKQARKQSQRRTDRGDRIRIETALLDAARGETQKAEASVRKLVERDPSNPRLFVALANVLEAGQQLIPAHAELLRASERVAATSLDGQWIATELKRLQATIEAQAHAIASGAAAPAAAAGGIVPTEGPAAPEKRDHVRTVRRRPGKPEDEADAAAAEGEGDGAPAESEADAAPAEADAAPADAASVDADAAPAQPDADASEPAADASEPAADASEPVADASAPVADDTPKA